MISGPRRLAGLARGSRRSLGPLPPQRPPAVVGGERMGCLVSRDSQDPRISAVLSSPPPSAPGSRTSQQPPRRTDQRSPTIKAFAEGRVRHRLQVHAQTQLEGGVTLRSVALPPGAPRAMWVDIHVIDFYNEVGPHLRSHPRPGSSRRSRGARALRPAVPCASAQTLIERTSSARARPHSEFAHHRAPCRVLMTCDTNSALVCGVAHGRSRSSTRSSRRTARAPRARA